MGKVEALSANEESLQLRKEPVPLVANLIKLMRNLGIPEIDIQSPLVDTTFKKFCESYLLSLAVRHAGDQTGILGPLVGVSQSPEETRKILTEIEENLLKKLEEKKLKDQTLSLLNGEQTNDINVFLAIDDLIGEAVRMIRQKAVNQELARPKLNNMTLKAFDFWLHNRLNLYRLARNEGKEPWQLLNLEPVYDVTLGEKKITDIHQKPEIPRIDFGPLLDILPPELNRNINIEPPPIDKSLGFISRLNMAGSPIFRYLIENVRQYLETKSLTERITSLP